MLKLFLKCGVIRQLLEQITLIFDKMSLRWKRILMIICQVQVLFEGNKIINRKLQKGQY